MVQALSPFQYYGAKNKLAPWILGFMKPHRVYIEPFAGSAAVLFAKAPVALEIINDKSDDIVTFFRVLRDEPDRLVDALTYTPYSRTEYALAWDGPPPLSDVERARRFYVRASYAYNGQSGKRAGYSASARAADGSLRPKAKPHMADKVDRLYLAAERLRSVEIENVDALALIGRWDAPDVLLYCDPPYTLDARTATGNYGMHDDVSHEALLTRLCSFSGQVVLSGYDNPLYRELLCRGWTVHHREVVTSTNNTSANGSRRVETLWVKD